jgi:hypothetical protein
MSRSRPPCRLHLLKAEAAPVACVIRRGPTRWFHVALWDHEARTVDHGAWTRIKLYPERCALSRDGERLAVFALGGEWGPYFAVSRAPWLHALAAWETVGTWTTGAHFHEDTLVLAGCVGPEPFHGEYPDGVACEGTDTRWGLAGMFRELRTGWSLVPVRDTDGAPAEEHHWLDALPAPLATSPDPAVAVRPNPADPRRVLVLVSLWPGQREYYLREGDRILPLPSVTRAEWGTGTEMLVTTDSGHLQVLGKQLETLWEYDMDLPEPEPRAAPEWATRPFPGGRR